MNTPLFRSPMCDVLPVEKFGVSRHPISHAPRLAAQEGVRLTRCLEGWCAALGKPLGNREQARIAPGKRTSHRLVACRVRLLVQRSEQRHRMKRRLRVPPMTEQGAPKPLTARARQAMVLRDIVEAVAKALQQLERADYPVCFLKPCSLSSPAHQRSRSTHTVSSSPGSADLSSHTPGPLYGPPTASQADRVCGKWWRTVRHGMCRVSPKRPVFRQQKGVST